LFPSFFLAGFECSTPINRHGERVDQIVATQHDRFLGADYAVLRRRGIRAVREGVRWHRVDQRGRHDMQSLRPFVEAARRWDIVPIWDLFHYGYPEDLDPFGPEFVPRFAEYCYAVAQYVDRRMDGTPFFTPVNEISYFAWAAGDRGLFAPHADGRSWELKVILVQAALAGIEAIWAVNPRARIVNADPLCRVVAPSDRPDLEDEAAHFSHHVVYQSWDMLAGRLLPELGGSRRHLDIVGVNYYWTNQWEHTRPGVPLAADDPRLLPLSELLLQVHARYGGEVVITEAAHHGEYRAPWMAELASQVRLAMDHGARIGGVCWYPIVGMTEWHEPSLFVPMGLWDLVADGDLLRRAADPELMTALARAQEAMAPHVRSARPRSDHALHPESSAT
jgi:beta-glucosidase/6-phospho-beta-glucosidase/beta-galactosidase